MERVRAAQNSAPDFRQLSLQDERGAPALLLDSQVRRIAKHPQHPTHAPAAAATNRPPPPASGRDLTSVL